MSVKTKVAIDYSPLNSAVDHLEDTHNIKVSIRALQSKSRKAHFVFYRAVVAMVLKIQGYGCSQIGRMMHKDHATVINLWNYNGKKQLRDPRYQGIIIKELSGGDYHCAPMVYAELCDTFNVNGKKRK